MSITTKTGDEGMTSLFYGTRVPKTDLRVQSCGTVDELSAAMGVARSLMSDVCKEKNILLESQKDLI
ncbi:MAG: ATP:cob(I)alamin adenosyltransferase, partial [Verrucomicrobia bacterium]|nr:ATP:cob(I)alamin adenosyltransferase [Verrucomicrobiota bacterium]